MIYQLSTGKIWDLKIEENSGNVVFQIHLYFVPFLLVFSLAQNKIIFTVRFSLHQHPPLDYMGNS